MPDEHLSLASDLPKFQLKNILKELSVTIIVLAFLYICGGLYLLAYWDTFNISFTNLVDISEIPKNFILPFVCVHILFLIPNFRFIYLLERIKPRPNSKGIWSVLWEFEAYAILFSITILVNFQSGHKFIYYWISSGILVGIFCLTKAFNCDYLKEQIANVALRTYLVVIMICTPIIAIILAKSESLSILHNSSIQNVHLIEKVTMDDKLFKQDSIQLKLLGFIGDKVIVGTLDNRSKLIISKSAAELIKLDEIHIKR